MPRNSVDVYYIARHMKAGGSMNGGPMPHLTVDRLALTVDERHKQCKYEAPEPLGVKERLKKSLKESSSLCSKTKLQKAIYRRLPILDWLIGYDFRNWFVHDLIAGVTVAIMQIPIGMGFALLAYMPAICGIYMAFFQSLIYAILATSRHNSMGAFAVITLMTGKVVKELATFPDETVDGVAMGGNASIGSLFGAPENVNKSLTGAMGEGIYTPVQVATVVCFMVGVWHMILGMLQLGSLSVFFSDMLVSGFTTAAAFHILTSQLQDLLGLSIKSHNGPFKLIYIFIEICSSLGSVNVLTLITSILTITILVINNEVLKSIVAKHSKIPVPIELIVLIIGTAASYFANLAEEYEVTIVGDIPTGFPAPETPPLELLGQVLVDSLIIAIVSYTVNFSLAKIFASMHKYAVDATQELYATGVGNIVSSFFFCAPTASSLSRTLVQSNVGGVTQMASLIVCVIIALVISFIGPIFKTLPKAVLSSVIVVALKGMFMQFKDLVAMWKVSRVEASIWLVTFLSTVVLDIDIGLVVGISFSLAVLLTKNQRPTSFVLGRVPKTDIYLDLQTYPQCREISGMKLFKIVGAIHFANRDNLRTLIVKGTGLDPQQLEKVVKIQTEDEFQKDKICHEAIKNGTYPFLENESKIRILILDCSGVSYIDSSGAKFLAQLKNDYEYVNIEMCLAGLPENIYEMMEKSGSLKSFSSEHLFHSLHDAVIILKSNPW